MSIDFEHSKYKNYPRFVYKRVERWFFRRKIAQLVNWKTQDHYVPGYSMVIACNINLKEILYVILELISRQDTRNLHELMIAFEITESRLDPDFRQGLLDRFPRLPITFITYNPVQSRIARLYDWPWLYSWLSWCKAIARAKTKYLILHDFDALPIRQNFFEERYQHIQDKGSVFLGVQYYVNSGFKEQDGLATTWELILDTTAVRSKFQPIEIFNHVRRHNDRLLEFDTFLWAQEQTKSTVVVPVALPDDLVHLGNVISQHTDFMNGRHAKANNILFIPYMMFASGQEEWISRTTTALSEGTWPYIDYLGRTLDLSPLDRERVDWIATLAERAELALVGHVRPQVTEYLDAMRDFVERRSARLAVSQV